MVAADTIADLATAVLAGAPKPPRRSRSPRRSSGEGVAAPRSARSLVEALVWQAERNPDRPHLLLREDAGEERTITYGELGSRAQAVATGLRQRNLGIGETVSLMLRTEEAFFAGFFGVLLAGGVPVPIYPPFRLDRLEEYAHRQVGILRNARGCAAHHVRRGHPDCWLAALARAVPARGRDRGSARGVRGRPGMHARAPGPRLDPVHLGQHRGAEGCAPLARQPARQHSRDRRGARLATGRRRGELASALPRHGAHRDVAHGIVLRAADRGDVTTRLPVATLALAVERARAPRHGLACAELRLRALRRARSGRGHRRSRPELLAAGVERVRGGEPDTIHRFTRRFAAYGFRADAMCPVYGLAESSVALTVPPLRRPPRIDCIARDPFQASRRVVAAAAGESTPLRFVWCGRAIPGHDVRIVDQTGHALAERVDGRIEFRGPSVTTGYYRRPEVTRAVFHDGWMDSGDLGYLADGELFITGRQRTSSSKGGATSTPRRSRRRRVAFPASAKGASPRSACPIPRSAPNA